MLEPHVRHIDMKKKILIVGGGTAGWMTASALSKALHKTNYQIQLVESEVIGTVGVGEATIPSIRAFNDTLGLNEADFLRETMGSFKLGIEFVNWGKLGGRYIHPFGTHGVNLGPLSFYHYWLKMRNLGISESIGDYCISVCAARAGKFVKPQNIPGSPLSQINYAYHFDASRYAKLLRAYSEARGVERIDGEIYQVNLNSGNGYIDNVALKDGRVLQADFFIDCSGFRSLLLGGALNVGYESWGDNLLCDRAVVVQTENENDEMVPYTKSTAHAAGWQWRIPLQHRAGNGHVYSSRYMSDEIAEKILVENISGEMLTKPRIIEFNPGMRKRFWYKNCVGIGLASGFLEPLESTSIYLVQRAITKLISFFPNHEIYQKDVDKYNELMVSDYCHARDFIILHYKVSTRDDSPFWRYCRDMDVPESLSERIDLFKNSGRLWRENDECFAEDSWVTVLFGQGQEAKAYSPLVDGITDEELKRYSSSIRQAIENCVMVMPTHKDFIKKYCGV